MKNLQWFGISVLSAAIACHAAQAQVEAQGPPAHSVAANSATNPQSVPVDLDWTPSALVQLSAQAATKSSFTLDRTMLAAASSMIPDSEPETRQAIGKIDGISVHLLRFPASGVADQALVEALRETYHQRGWKHVVLNKTASTANPSAKRPLANGTTDVWVVMDGANLRGAVALVESPRKVTLISLAGNISSVDLLHLRGHFGIPRYDADQLTGQR